MNESNEFMFPKRDVILMHNILYILNRRDAFKKEELELISRLFNKIKDYLKYDLEKLEKIEENKELEVDLDFMEEKNKNELEEIMDSKLKIE